MWLRNNVRERVYLFWFGGFLGSTSRAKYPVSPSNHVGFKQRLHYSNTQFYPSEDWLSSRCLTSVIAREMVSWQQSLGDWNLSELILTQNWKSSESEFVRIKICQNWNLSESEFVRNRICQNWNLSELAIISFGAKKCYVKLTWCFSLS